MPNDTRLPLETTNSPQHTVQHISTTQKDTDVSCLKQGFADVSSENQVEPCSLAQEPSTVTTPSSCESGPPLADNPNEEEMDEDQTIFFTPELFEGEEDEGSTQKETESPSRMILGTGLSALLSEEPFYSEQAEGQGETSAFDRHSDISVSEMSTELSEGHKIRRRSEEGAQVDNHSKQTGSRLHRLSKSRPKFPSTPAGNQ